MHKSLSHIDAEITQPSQERVILPNLTVSDLDRGGGVGVPDVGGSDLRAGEAAVAHVSHQSAVGGVDIRAQAETVGSIDYRKWELCTMVMHALLICFRIHVHIAVETELNKKFAKAS